MSHETQTYNFNGYVYSFYHFYLNLVFASYLIGQVCLHFHQILAYFSEKLPLHFHVLVDILETNYTLILHGFPM